MTGPGSGGEDYPAALDHVLGTFETALADRWQQTIHDAIVHTDPIPPALHIYQNRYSEIVWEHRRPEVHAHVLWGDCPYLAWYTGGRSGDLGSITCAGKIREPDEHDKETVFWPQGDPGGTQVEVPESIDCGIGLLLAAGAEWAYQDRKYIFDALPMFANQKLSALESARDALVEMAGNLGAEADGEGDPALRTSLALADQVDAVFVRRDEETDWRAGWTGTAADRAAEGFFASTKPTLINHALTANGLSALVNERATIVNTYRNNTIGLIMAATEALGAEAETTTDLTGVWKTMKGLNEMIGLVPQVKAVSTTITVVAWLGERFLKEVKDVSFASGPDQVAIGLYDQVLAMNESLAAAEEDYTTDVAAFRAAIDAVPSTFLELYDLTENSPTGQH
ncbi:MAG: hypothetical protein M3422_19780 [Actinomycetota bacterium]|nr:hypothetical protein [Actinomycetota bacterium]